MNGLALCRSYFETYGRPMLDLRFPKHSARIAAGLVGEGSECLGYDDEISRDHDYGPGFCLWLAKEDYDEIGQELQRAYLELPREYGGLQRMTSAQGQGRVGVFETGAFYRRFTGLSGPPETLLQWLRLPESYLATATSGEVFWDPLGAFSEIRQTYLNYYPEDVRRKKLAARAVQAAQAGQYNFSRCWKHGESVAAGIALHKFIEAAISMAHLLCRRYMPYYKWMHRSLAQLPKLSDLAELIQRLSRIGGYAEHREEAEDLIEQISARLIWELRTQGLSDSQSDFLQDHGYEIMCHISDPTLRARNILEG